MINSRLTHPSTLLIFTPFLILLGCGKFIGQIDQFEPTYKVVVNESESHPTEVLEVKSELPPDKQVQSKEPIKKSEDKPSTENPPTIIKNPEKSESTEVNQTQKYKIVEKGYITPTVYYFPVINEDKIRCKEGYDKSLHDPRGKVLIDICASSAAVCAEQGTCAIIKKNIMHSFNIWDRVRGQDRYIEMSGTSCLYGFGVNDYCLDPFYTIAADLSIYKVGDVIFIPAIVGLILPNGSAHNGYFIVRDRGDGISGRGRFDFYSGFFGWNDNSNPFKKIGLADIKTHLPYIKIVGEKAREILKERSYPSLPH